MDIAGGTCANCMWTERDTPCSWKGMSSSDPAFVGRTEWKLDQPAVGVLFDAWGKGPEIQVDLEQEIRDQEAAYAEVKRKDEAAERAKVRKKALRDLKKGRGKA